MRYNFAILKALKELRMTQTDLSEVSGLNQTLISQIINGRIVPSEGEKQKICIALKKPEQELF